MDLEDWKAKGHKLLYLSFLHAILSLKKDWTIKTA